MCDHQQGTHIADADFRDRKSFRERERKLFHDICRVRMGYLGQHGEMDGGSAGDGPLSGQFCQKTASHPAELRAG